MMKTMTKLEHLEQVAEILEQHDNFAILTHRFPDGDTLGSAYALCGMLQQKGKRQKCFSTENYSLNITF